jgi:hypothetical protein
MADNRSNQLKNHHPNARNSNKLRMCLGPFEISQLNSSEKTVLWTISTTSKNLTWFSNEIN